MVQKQFLIDQSEMTKNLEILPFSFRNQAFSVLFFVGLREKLN